MQIAAARVCEIRRESESTNSTLRPSIRKIMNAFFHCSVSVYVSTNEIDDAHIVMTYGVVRSETIAVGIGRENILYQKIAIHGALEGLEL